MTDFATRNGDMCRFHMSYYRNKVHQIDSDKNRRKERDYDLNYRSKHIALSSLTLNK
jgi:hypothetical protein